MSWVASYSTAAPTGLVQYTTNIPTANTNPAFYGLDFTRWIVRIPGTGGAVAPNAGAVNATYEVLEDDYSGASHIFTLAPADPIDSTSSLATRVYNNPQSPIVGTPTVPSPNVVTLAHPLASGAGRCNFYLDGRYMRAFNGPGMSAFNPSGFDTGSTPTYSGFDGAGHPYNNAGYGNFRVNGNLLVQASNGTNPANPPAAANLTPAMVTRPPSAWTRTTTPATWRTGSWPCSRPTAR